MLTNASAIERVLAAGIYLFGVVLLSLLLTLNVFHALL